MFGRSHHQHESRNRRGARRSGLARLLVIGAVVALIARAVSVRRARSPRPLWHA